jgi:hypothetical protein
MMFAQLHRPISLTLRSLCSGRVGPGHNAPTCNHACCLARRDQSKMTPIAEERSVCNIW